jgi:DNA modification methylase
MTARLLCGDIRERLAEIPDHSVNLIVTSPPFLALRSYLPADHPDKTKEIGSEPNPAAYLGTLLDLTEEWRRVLTPYGSICVELGDTYAGSGTTLAVAVGCGRDATGIDLDPTNLDLARERCGMFVEIDV